MSSKASSILDKVQRELQRNSVTKALEKLEDGIRKHPEEFELYVSALEITLEAGESVKAQKYFSSAMSRFPSYQERLWTEAVGLISRYNDAVLAKAALDFAIKKRDFDSAQGVLGYLAEPTTQALLKRVQTKKMSLSNASGGLALANERLLNSFSEALLLIRLKQHADGAKILLDIIDEKPIETKNLTPLFYHLEKTNLSEPGYAYGLGRCYLLEEQYGKAIPKIMGGVEMNREWVKDAIQRLEAIKGNSHVPFKDYNLSLGRLYIMTGDVHHANEILRLVLARDHRSASRVLDLLEPEIADVGDNLILDYLYIDAALQADRIRHVLMRLRRIYNVEKHQEDLLEWFNTRQRGILPVELLTLYGEIVLDRKMYEKAVEVLRQVVALSPHEAGAIREMLEPHTSDSVVEGFYNELVAESEDATPSDEGGFKIEHLGGSTDFVAPRSPKHTRRKEDKKRPNPFRDSSPFASKQSRPAIEMDDKPGGATEKEDRPDLTRYSDREVSLDSLDPAEEDSRTSKQPSWAKEAERQITFGSDESTEAVKPDTDVKPAKEAASKRRIRFDSDKNVDPPARPEPGGSAAKPPASRETDPPAAEPGPPPAPVRRPDAPDTRKEPERKPDPPVARTEPDNKPAALGDPKALGKKPEAPEVRREEGKHAPEVDERPKKKPAAPEVDQKPREKPAAPEIDEKPEEKPAPEIDEKPREKPAAPEIDKKPKEKPAPEIDKKPKEKPAQEIDKKPKEKPAQEIDEKPKEKLDPPDIRKVSAPKIRPDASRPAAESTRGEPGDFAERMRRFEEGRLDAGEALELAERAMNANRLDDMKRLLTLKPETDEQRLMHQVYVADYHMAMESPMEALHILEMIKIEDITGEWKRDCLIRLAACYQKLNRTDAAKMTYLTLISEFPGFDETEQMEKTIYRKYLREIVNGAMVLEKVTDL